MAKADIVLCNPVKEFQSHIEMPPTNQSPETFLISEYQLFQSADINKITKFPFACLPPEVLIQLPSHPLYSLAQSLSLTSIKEYLKSTHRRSNAFFLTG